MGADISGWIEVDTLKRHNMGDTCVCPVVDISVVVERDYGVFGRLFGVRHERGVVPLFPNRGLPESVSLVVKNSLQSEECLSYAYAEEIGEELQSICECNRHLKGWQFALDSLISLFAIYGTSSVRLVVGFDNA